jgi:UDPglucose--hexose-1-phosphate uridylyltransferase
LIVNKLNGQPVVIVSGRQKRPNISHETSCPFCPGGLEAPTKYKVRHFVNRYPSMVNNRCEVLLFNPKHSSTLATMSERQLNDVMNLFKERTAELYKRRDISYVLIFENHGHEVGATIDHPHGQIYAFEKVPPVVITELKLAKKTGCFFCEKTNLTLKLSETKNFISFVPNPSAYPFEILITSKKHINSLLDENISSMELGVILGTGLKRFRGLFNKDMPYMLFIHQGPLKGRLSEFGHLHIHILGIWRKSGLSRYVAAGELGSGVMFNPVDPKNAREMLLAVKSAEAFLRKCRVKYEF